MMGYNNGKIAVSQRQLMEALGCAPRKIVRGVAELMEHGLIDVQVEGKWKERMARQYRLTFVTTKNGSATNDYLRWKPTLKSGATASVSIGPQSDSAPVTRLSRPVASVVAVLPRAPRKTANSEYPPASDEVSLISKPYVAPASWWTADHYLRANRAILALVKAQSLRAAA
jgi:hypothetical protein